MILESSDLHITYTYIYYLKKPPDSNDFFSGLQQMPETPAYLDSNVLTQHQASESCPLCAMRLHMSAALSPELAGKQEHSSDQRSKTHTHTRAND